jgi:integrase
LGIHHCCDSTQYIYSVHLSEEVAARLRAWHSEMVPLEAVIFAREVVAMAGPASPERAKALLYAASRFGAFGIERGTELSPGVVRRELIERFAIEMKAKISASTRRTLRTNLLALARSIEPYPEPLQLPLPRERVKKPYTSGEISAYLALADAQPTKARASRASALVCLGAGAGAVRADLRDLRGADVMERSGGVVVVVRGPRPRVVPVLARYGPRLLADAASAGAGLIVSGGSPTRRNLTAPLVASLAGGHDLPRLEAGRLRATWLAEVAGLIGLGAFMDAAGVDISQRLGDIAALVPAPGEAEAVAVLGGRRC